MEVGLAYVGRLIAGAGELTGHGVRVFPGRAVLVPDHALSVGGLAGHEGTARGYTGRAGGVGVGESGANPGHGVEVRCLRYWMSEPAEAVAPKVVCEDEQEIGAVSQGVLFHEFGNVSR